MAHLEYAGGRVLPLSADLRSKSPVGQRYEALKEAIARFGPPEIMNTDQGSQFTSFVWTDQLRRSGVRISPLGRWIKFYNRKRPHSALGGKPLAVVYWLRKDDNQPDQQE
ncbi:Integrase core domain [Aliiroseovarius crassostreae]|nr:Integrase core domain [Aliiroseovarius crassostreae]